MNTIPPSTNSTETSRPAQPVFVRLPKPGERCLYTGLSRSTLCELTVPSPANEFHPPVASHVIKGLLATRGVRLICLRSLLDHIDSLAA